MFWTPDLNYDLLGKSTIQPVSFFQVYSVNNKPKESSKKLSDIVKEKFGGKRRSSKEPLEISLSDHDVIESDKGPDIAIAELDNVINSYHNKSSNSGGKVFKILGLAKALFTFCLELKHIS